MSAPLDMLEEKYMFLTCFSVFNYSLVLVISGISFTGKPVRHVERRIRVPDLQRGDGSTSSQTQVSTGVVEKYLIYCPHYNIQTVQLLVF